MDDSSDLQETLVESSLPLLLSTYEEALIDGVDSPVVFLVDCEDPMGAEMATAWTDADAVDDAVALQRLDRDNQTETTVFSRAISMADCRREVPGVFPYLSDALKNEPPEGKFFAICITEGGAAVLSVPFA